MEYVLRDWGRQTDCALFALSVSTMFTPLNDVIAAALLHLYDPSEETRYNSILWIIVYSSIRIQISSTTNSKFNRCKYVTQKCYF